MRISSDFDRYHLQFALTGQIIFSFIAYRPDAGTATRREDEFD
jgi:hypothetical protein